MTLSASVGLADNADKSGAIGMTGSLTSLVGFAGVAPVEVAGGNVPRYGETRVSAGALAGIAD